MDVDMEAAPLPSDNGAEAPRTLPESSDAAAGPSGMMAPVKKTPVTRAPPPRTLRVRPSLPTPAQASTSTSAPTASGNVRGPTEKELRQINTRLGPEAVQARKDELLKEKEEELRLVVDGHDTAVREKFHLERFVTMVTGWDPQLAKVDNSPVFLDYKRFNHNLFDLAPPPPPNAVAGPSRPRNSLPSRTTRRQAHDITDILSAPKAEVVAEAPAAATSSKGKSRLSDASTTDTKGKKKADAAAQPVEEVQGKGKGRVKTERESMPPPLEPVRKKARASVSGATIPEVDDAGAVGETKGKGRASLPNLPVIKRGPGRPPKVRPLLDDSADPTEDVLTSSEPATPVVKRKPGRPPKIRLLDPLVSSPIAEPEPEADPDPEPEPTSPGEPPTPLAPALPSLAHIPFPPPPHRVRPRRVGPNRIWYTDPLQRPPPAPPHGGNISSVLTSFILLEDSGPPPELPALELRAAREGFIRNRVNYLQSQGRLLRLLDDPDSDGPQSASLAKSKAPLVQRQQDHQDHLMAHMRQVRNAMLDEARAKLVYCKRIARLVMAYWEHLEGREDREKAEVEREMKRKGRDVIKGLRRKWGLAVKVIKARMTEAQKAEQDRLGKEHLQNMLQRSTGLLEAQQQYGDDEEAEEEASDGTEDVSSADDSDEEGEDGNGEEVNPGAEDAEGDEKTGQPEVERDEEDMEVDEVEGVFGLEGEDQEDGDGLPAESEVIRPVSALDPALDDEKIGDNNNDDSSGRMGESGSDSGSASPPADIRDLLVDLEDPSPLAAIHDRPVAEAAPEENIPADAPLEPVPTASAPVILTADESTRADPAPTGSGPVPVIRSRRARHVAPPSHLLEKADPDADDIEFSVNGDSDEDADEAMDLEMEEAEDGGEGEGGGDKADSEDEGLLADADMPIEELLRRYGVPSSDEAKAESDDGTVPVKGDGPSSVDQSLLDENLHGDSHTLLNDGGKRQRRARQVWTPEDNPPPPPKKVRIEEVKITPEQTPELSSEEEESEEEEEEVGEIGDVAAGERGMEVEEDPNAPKTRVPFLLRGTLRPYQHAGLDWLAGLYANNMNGILADEMGLGKTIQTISLLAHLACDRGVWGQHLVIVPTSVILNWEMEFKKFLPGFKVLTYYGSQKERKEKRVGWLTEHSWQVCITSYQIVLADQHIFRRKSWVYMILDEAHNIKNFRSQRWQTLLGFKAQRRLLLTGTPLQNNLMELWSLLYFLMPHGVAEEATAVVGFANHRDFVEWFSNPMDKAVESGDVLDEQALATVSKLHTLLRPFILRRLKAEVEKQLPGKFEHVVYCRLSKRQRFLYDEFMSRASTKDALTSGGYLGVMNTLMQLRKVCNHPDLFEVRPVRTSFAMDRSVAADFTPLDILVRKRLLAKRDEVDLSALNLNITSNESVSGWTAYARRGLDGSDHLPHAIEVKQKGRQPAPPPMDLRTVDGWLKYRAAKEEEESVQRWRSLRDVNRIRCGSGPIYGFTFLSMLSEIPQKLSPLDAPRTKRDLVHDLTPPSSGLILSLDDRRKLSLPLVEKFAVIPPAATARDLASLALPSLQPNSHPSLLDPSFDTLHHASTKLQIAFPDSSLLQYDCGKLQKLAEMLRDLKADGHRCLIFAQMTRVLDILEIFLNYNGHRYLRLDGSTKIEDRQIITERFNSDNKIFCFIASSRSGGVGINLTGADTVFFYDSDWNPSMDRQCMDRAHRIGQTREVHIYRFVSSHTVEENMLKKANQKRLLDKVIIQEGDFTTEFFGRVDWRETLYDGDEPKRLVEEEEKDGVEDIPVEEEPEAEVVEEYAPRRGEEREFAKMVAEVEDEEDVQAARVALGEGEMDMGDFEADGAAKREAQVGKKTAVRFEGGGTPMTPGAGDEGVVGDESMVVDGEEEEEEEVGGVDEYMLRLVEWDWASFASYR